MPSIYKQYEKIDKAFKIPDVKVATFTEKKDIESDVEVDSKISNKDNGLAKRLSKDDLAILFKDEIEKAIDEAKIKAYRDAYDVARTEGYNEGAKKAFEKVHSEMSKQILETIENTDDVLKEIEKKYDAYFLGYSKELKFLAITISEKILQKEIKTDNAFLDKLVSGIISNIKDENWISVEVSNKLVELINHLKKELENTDFQGNIKVNGVNGQEDTCVVKTESGSIIASPSIQIENLKKAFSNQDKQV